MRRSHHIAQLGLALFGLALVAGPAIAQSQDNEPPLPSGLDDPKGDKPSASDDDEPSLPSGLGGDESGDDEPGLPSGLNSDHKTSAEVVKAPAKPWALPFSWRMFVDVRGGVRTQKDAVEGAMPLAEARLQLELSRTWLAWSTGARATADFVYDSVASTHSVDIETGQGAIDLRTASIVTSPTAFLDVKLGRHVLTWGTGDLVFINDLFPKDWTAFLSGRDVEYLKAPSDAIKLGVFSETVSADIVFTPRFDADRLPLRERLSTWDPATNTIVGDQSPIMTAPPDRWGTDSELAGRIYRTVAGYELAAYGYYGFHKSPAGFDPMSGAATFPRLGVYGASARGTLAQGIANVEVGYYDSLDDRSGSDPTVRNSEARALVGYEHELAKGVTGSAQYYVEFMLRHGRYRRDLAPASPVADQLRHVVSVRLHWLLDDQRLTAGLFVFASPSDKDMYVRPNIKYKVDDHWRAEVGANVFVGADDHTFFGQLRGNSNVYAALRYAR